MSAPAQMRISPRVVGSAGANQKHSQARTRTPRMPGRDLRVPLEKSASSLGEFIPALPGAKHGAALRTPLVAGRPSLRASHVDFHVVVQLIIIGARRAAEG